MKKAIPVLLLTLAAALLFAQQQRRPMGAGPGRISGGSEKQAPAFAAYEVLSVFPQETSPGEYLQVDPSQLQQLADKGWQLVSVAPYIYRNEEHANGTASAPLITQVYEAYFFKRGPLTR